jgi:glyoxylase-like metal-dependent hydrolase (beta-lactamase superfamily II)
VRSPADSSACKNDLRAFNRNARPLENNRDPVRWPMASVVEYERGISAIDSGYQRPQLDAIHLIVEAGRAAIVDTGVNSSVPRVMAALESKGIPPHAVDYVVLTHIHLDHAGGAGLLLSRLPNAMLTVHPRGARHMSLRARRRFMESTPRLKRTERFCRRRASA